MISTNFCIRVQLNNFSRESISQIVKRVYVTRINFILLCGTTTKIISKCPPQTKRPQEKSFSDIR